MSTCAVVAASDFNRSHFMTAYEAGTFNFVLAVDGGYAYLSELGVEPDLSVGDFDSLGYVPQGDTVQASPHKDESDMELALDWLHDHGYERVVIYGALGRRLDHTIANLQVFSHFSEEGMVILTIDETTALTMLTGPGDLVLPARESGIVSVFSMNDMCRGVHERGLEYELDDACLSGRRSRGLSNEFSGQSAEIGVDSGTLAIIYPL